MDVKNTSFIQCLHFFQGQPIVWVVWSALVGLRRVNLEASMKKDEEATPDQIPTGTESLIVDIA